jgi:hypothetical protein
MSGSSWFFKSEWASVYFRPAPEGQIFTYRRLFGGSREYRLSNEQAERLVERVSHASSRCHIMFCVGVPLIVAGAITAAVMLRLDPYSSGFLSILGVPLLLLTAVGIAMPYRAAATVLAGIPWTSVPTERLSWAERCKHAAAFEVVMLPTWVLVGTIIGFPLCLLGMAGPAYSALVAGHMSKDVLVAALLIFLSIDSVIKLVRKRRAQRAGEQ